MASDEVKNVHVVRLETASELKLGSEQTDIRSGAKRGDKDLKIEVRGISK